ncbi:DNA polymerase III subunit alpha [Thermoactinomyces mirandus]|uniref:DNA polymerase III subunit alpha n=1 Tax=Thermoactinomyces mirandus TaxID=2756294 RepID=A0A7W1XQZ9_9BACL|nr:DNA polymerase III subunit alpha [Thermoactinomyces mirandus]MBA4601591.1 DNA polymerase III subunit alpha [Thermoactinomyces mirandus]
MERDDFVHLHLHTEYSLLDGAARIKEVIAKAKQSGMKALAITDHGVMYGVLPFYKTCLEEGIKPVIGCEMYLTPDDYQKKPSLKKQKNYHLLLLAESNEGYRNLIRLSTEAHLHGFHYKPRIDRKLLRKYASGLIATSSCLNGEIPQAILRGDYDEARRLVGEYTEIFGKDCFYFELQDHQLPEQQKVNRVLIRWAEEMDIPLVATNDVHYIEKSDNAIHDCLLCIGTGSKLKDENRLRFSSDQFYLKSAAEMKKLFQHVPEAIHNTVRIAERCKVDIPLGQHLFPRFKVPDGMNARDYLRKLCYRGARSRFETITARIRDRLDYELKIIDRMDLNDYFLVVWDFVRFAHQQGIAVGPGRGSAAGSLVAYVLYITQIDPIRYGLLFERFLNPERVSMPDIDIDFNYERRDEVIRYVVEKYGADHVAQIITFGTMAPRAAVRDLGRVMGLPYSTVDKLAKMIPGNPGMTLEKACQLEPRLKQLGKDPQMSRLLEAVKKIEGIPRHISTHAAGVVISSEPLTNFVPLQEGNEGIPLTQYPMEVLEDIGLLKADFLGLRNLTIIENALRFIKQSCGTAPDFSQMEYDDPATYHMLSRGETTGVFQLESPGMQKVLKEMKPTRFEDIIAALALHRPGPMEQIPRFIRAKNGLEKVHYLHPDLEGILENTYGIIIYQEQIMKIAAKMAGFSLGQADLLRRAVSKKKREWLLEYRQAFVKGCMEQGYDEPTGEQIYDLIVRFADYGFNRSHSAAYGVLAYQSAYLKANYPLEFMAALLQTVVGNHAKLAEYIEEARRMGIRVLPPDVQKSDLTFSVENSSIRFGLLAVKNVGTSAIKNIIEARKEGPFHDLLDLCRRIDLHMCNRRVLSSLIECGAMDSFPGHRSQNLAILDEVIDTSMLEKQLANKSQLSLVFSEKKSEDINRFLASSRVSPFTEQENLEKERELLGLYLSGHPLDAYQNVINQTATHTIAALRNCRDREQVKVAGWVSRMKVIRTRKGEQMAFLTVADRRGQVEAVLFPKGFARYRTRIEEGSLLFIKGTVQEDEEDQVKLIIDWVRDLRELKVLETYSQTILYLRISQKMERPDLLSRLKTVILDNPGNTPVHLYYERVKKLRALPVDRYGISLTESCISRLKQIVGEDGLRVKHK